MSIARQLSPSEFAALSVGEQRDYQVAIADDIFSRRIAGVAVSQAEADFAERILLKKIPDAPTPTGFENTARGVETLLNTTSTATASALWKNLTPFMVLGVIVLGVLYFVNKKG